MRKVSKILSTGAVAVGMLMNAPFALAAEPIINLKPPEIGKLGEITYNSLITGAIRIILVAAALIFFFVLVIGGIQWILAGGDKAGAESARKRITSALVGLAIVFAAWAIASLINALFGFDIFGLQIKPLY